MSRRRLIDLVGEDLLKEAQNRAAYSQNAFWFSHYRAKEYLMIVANMAQNFYCADEFTKNHGPNADWYIGARKAALFTLMVGTLVSNFFSKILLLHDVVNGLGFSREQKRIYRAIERGVQKSQLLLNPGEMLHVTLTPEDLQTLGRDGFILTYRLLEAIYGIKLVMMSTQPGVGADFDPLLVRGEDALWQHMHDPMADLPEPLIELRLNHDSEEAEVGAEHVVHESSLSGWQTFCHNPLAGAYYATKWLLFRLGPGLTYVFSINHSLHNLAQSWGDVKNSSSASVLWTLLVCGLVTGGYRALANNSITSHKIYRELNLLDGRRQFGLRPKISGKALAVSLIPIAVTMFFNVSLSIFFGGGGLASLYEQTGWLLRGEAYEMPKWLGTAVIAWFMIGNVAGDVATTEVETYRKVDNYFQGKTAGRVDDRSTHEHPYMWKFVLFNCVLDSINYALVGANSTDSAWKGDDLMGETGAYVCAMVIFSMVTITATMWSLSTALPLFSSTMQTLANCRRRKGTEEADETDATRQGLMRHQGAV